MSLCKAPVSVINDMESMIRRFVWSGRNEKGLHLVAWESLCQLQEFGGLNLRSLIDINDSLLTKWKWRFNNSEENGVWKVFIREKYAAYPTERLPSKIPSSYGCSVWKTVSAYYKFYVRNSVVEIGNWNSIDLWSDRWDPEGTLKQLIPNLYDCCRQKRITVREAVEAVGRSGFGEIGLDRRLTDVQIGELAILAGKLQQVTLSERAYRTKWITGNSSSDCFTVKNMCGIISLVRRREDPTLSVLTPYKVVWGAPCPPMTHVLLWLLYRRRLPVRERLSRFGIVNDQACCMCEAEVEDCWHLFCGCPVASTLWKWTATMFRRAPTCEARPSGGPATCHLWHVAS